MNLDLSGKTALITGAESGLGEKIAYRLAGDGADIIIHYINSDEAAEKVAENVRKNGVKAYLVKANFCNSEEMQVMIEKVRSIGHVDILINNAGALFRRTRFLDEAAKDMSLWTKSFEVNYLGVVRLMREFIPDMCEKKWGRVVNISSVTCHMRTRTGATIHYTPMKSAVEALTIHVSDEVAQYGVTCNCVGPGNMRTPMVANAPLPDPSILNLYHTRRNADPDEVAATVEYLASPDASFVTGEVYYTAGGR